MSETVTEHVNEERRPPLIDTRQQGIARRNDIDMPPPTRLFDGGVSTVQPPGERC